MTELDDSLDTLYLLSDQPSELDLLDFEPYASALARLITSERTDTPLTIGIFGRWGSGKTTLMERLAARLKQEGLTTVWFDAWRYGKEEEIWAAFLQSLLNSLSDELTTGPRLEYRLRLFFRRLKWWRLLVSLLLLALFLLVMVLSTQGGQQQLIALFGAWGAGILAVLMVVEPLWKAVRAKVSINLADYYQRSDYQERIAFLDKFQLHFEDNVKSLPGNRKTKLAVFVDDLDRCPQDRVLSVLDAVHAFLGVHGCVYIIGLDAEVVQSAVAKKYEGQPIAQREYLQKIVQLPFRLPALSNETVELYLGSLDTHLPDARCIEVFSVGFHANPRELKRGINIFSLLWAIVTERENLRESIAPVRLAKVIVLQQAYPELYSLLQGEPSWLAKLEIFSALQDELAYLHNPGRQEMPEGMAAARAQAVEMEIGFLNLSDELAEYANDAHLRKMLLLYLEHYEGRSSSNKGTSFRRLDAAAIATYFTLTSWTSTKVIQPESTTFHSLVEVEIARFIQEQGFTFIQEPRLEAVEGVRIYPDFLLRAEGVNTPIYWDHSGRMIRQQARRDRLGYYRELGILPYGEGIGENGIIILTPDGPNGEIRYKEIAEFLESMRANTADDGEGAPRAPLVE